MEKFVFIFSFLWQFSACVGACYDMTQTIETVSGCPHTEPEWNVRAALKNCGAMCSDSSYHCLITKDMNAMIEVCAEPKYIQGYCTYFDTADDRIKGLYAADCSKYENPCPTRYYSTKAFQYQACYDLVRAYATVNPSSTSSTSVITKTENSTANTSNNTSEETSLAPIIIPIVLVLVIVVISFAILILIKRRRRSILTKRGKQPIDDFLDLKESEEGKCLVGDTTAEVGEMSPDPNADIIARIRDEYEEKFEEMYRKIQLLKTQKEKDIKDKEELKRQVLEKNKECKTLNNRLQEAKGNIRVLCRIRKCENSSCVRSTKTTVTIDKTTKNQESSKTYPFERVFGANSTQEEVYEEIRELIRSFLDGYNLCIFAYGQTGSGKTYTMEGPQGNDIEMKDDQGIIPRAMKQVFDMIGDLLVCGWTYQFRASYLELYNEEIRDLAKGSNDDAKHEIVGAKENKTIVTNIIEKEVKTTEEVLKFYKESSKNRAYSQTVRNERSSRSHAIFRLEMNGKVENIEGIQDTCSGTLTLVDLAGSERLDDSANTKTNKETKQINLSLLELTKVLRSLRNKESPTYRNSKLTHLLKTSLGGNSKTLMIVNVSPSEGCQKETERTLEFGREVSKVVLENVPRKNK